MLMCGRKQHNTVKETSSNSFFFFFKQRKQMFLEIILKKKKKRLPSSPASVWVNQGWGWGDYLLRELNPNLLKGMSRHGRLGEDDFTARGSGAGPPLETWVHTSLSFVSAMEHAKTSGHFRHLLRCLVHVPWSICFVLRIHSLLLGFFLFSLGQM